MYKFKQITDELGRVLRIETPLSGMNLLDNCKLNKGCGFTQQERETFELSGRLPYRIETLEEQTARIYTQYSEKTSDLQKNIFLNMLHDTNETLFYKLVQDHLAEMLPIIYTPTVGEAVEKFSHEFRRSRGLYIAYPERLRIKELLQHRLDQHVELIVVTDGEGVLGIGDQGVGGMSIPIAKLMVYTICGGVNPHHVLPIQLDVGTNNQELLKDPMYLGWRHERISGAEYDEFIGLFVDAVNEVFNNCYLHWEDFGRENARRNLLRYRDKRLTFNDDMQGTGAVTLAAVLAAINASGTSMQDQRIVIFGAGTAGVGIADQIKDALMRHGLSEKEAEARFWLLDRPGLLTDAIADVMDFQKPYLHAQSEVKNWQLEKAGYIGLADVVKNVHPTLLIGCSTRGGAFTEAIVKEMAAHVEHPIIFPLSNPTEKAEAKPADLLAWTHGKALIATGSPFAPVQFNGRTIRISQCNNAFVFPGLGLGVIHSKAKLLTDDVIWIVAKVLAEQSPALTDPLQPLLPDLAAAKEVSMKIGIAVAEKVRADGLATVSDDVDFKKQIPAASWEAKYYEYKKP